MHRAMREIGGTRFALSRWQDIVEASADDLHDVVEPVTSSTVSVDGFANVTGAPADATARTARNVPEEEVERCSSATWRTARAADRASARDEPLSSGIAPADLQERRACAASTSGS
jgi:hypothetical protein